MKSISGYFSSNLQIFLDIFVVSLSMFLRNHNKADVYIKQAAFLGTFQQITYPHTSTYSLNFTWFKFMYRMLCFYIRLDT